MRAFYIALGFVVLAIVAIPLLLVALVHRLAHADIPKDFEEGLYEAYPDDGHLPPAA